MFKLSKVLLFTVLSTAITTSAYQASAQLKVANLLQSNMVVQQGKPLRVWGTAKPGDNITITADWTNKITTAKTTAEGNWIGEITVPKTTTGNFAPHTLTVTDAAETTKLTNLLIGDLWYCVGQSNMEMPLTAYPMLSYKGVLNYKDEIAAANFPNIRICRVLTDFKVEPATTTKNLWQECSPKTIGDFSSIAYFFARKLYQTLNIPIGVVVSACPGASTQALTRRGVLENDTMLYNTYLKPSLSIVNSQKKTDSVGFFNKVTKPVILYNAIINPVLNLSIKGFVYYQGESNNRDKRNTYIPLFTSLVADYRKGFNQGDLPFYYTQIAPNIEDKDTLDTHGAQFRETQQGFMKIKNTGMAVTLDVGEPHNVHPRDKRPVGERLAFNALNKTYHLNTPYLGPMFSSFKVNGSVVTVSYKGNSVGTGLATKDGKLPNSFAVAGDDHVFYAADAKIDGNNIVLTCGKVSKPIAVRYAFLDGNVTNLQNKEGLPAMEFRTDDWAK